MFVVGVTGGTGGGKTTLLREIEAMGGRAIDCDVVYHELLLKNEALLGEIAAEFPGVVHNGALDRKALGSMVFADKAAMSRLGRITWKYVDKAVHDELEAAEKAGCSIGGIDAIGLIEGGFGKYCDKIIGVLAPAEARAKRIMEREGITEEYALLRIKAQKPDSFFIENCDYTIRNNFNTPEQFRAECRKLLEEIITTA